MTNWTNGLDKLGVEDVDRAIDFLKWKKVAGDYLVSDGEVKKEGNKERRQFYTEDGRKYPVAMYKVGQARDPYLSTAINDKWEVWYTRGDWEPCFNDDWIIWPAEIAIKPKLCPSGHYYLSYQEDFTEEELKDLVDTWSNPGTSDTEEEPGDTQKDPGALCDEDGMAALLHPMNPKRQAAIDSGEAFVKRLKEEKAFWHKMIPSPVEGFMMPEDPRFQPEIGNGMDENDEYLIRVVPEPITELLNKLIEKVDRIEKRLG